MNDILRLNNFPTELLKSTNDARSELVAVGRMLWLESTGRKTNKFRGNSDAYSEVMSAADFRAASEKHTKKLFQFCAKQALAVEGRTMENDEEYRRIEFARNEVFLRTLAGIVSDVISPVLPYIMDASFGAMMNTQTVEWGKTLEVTVNSNEAFFFEDGAYGALRATPANYLYSRTFTLNPRPYQAHAKAKWNQLMSNGSDAGALYNAIYAGLYNKIFGLYTNALQSAVANSYFMPSYLKANSYTSANWGAITNAVAHANGVQRSQLMAFGDYTALQAVLPKSTSVDGYLSAQMGEEWFKNGFIGMAGRVPLFELENTFVPGTVNTSGIEMFPTDQIFIAARAGDSYAPIYAAVNDAQGVTVEFRHPEDGTGDIDIFVEANIDVKPIFGAKIGFIDNVTL